MNIKQLLILFLSLFPFFSCSDNENSDAETGKYSVDIKNDVESFNIKTSEIILKSGQVVSESLSSIEAFSTKIGLSSTITFHLDGNSVFESIPMQPEYSSFVVNDLVFVLEDSKFYLLDGYPSLESLGVNRSESEKVRNENFEKRKENWNKFINYLRDAGKILE